MSYRIFVIHASHNLTDHAANGDGLVAWGYLSELARRGHRIFAITDKLDIAGQVPANLTLVEVPRRFKNPVLHYLTYMLTARRLFRAVKSAEGVDLVHQMNPVVRGLSLALLGYSVPVLLGTYVGDWRPLRFLPNRGPNGISARLVDIFKLSLDALQQRFATAMALATPYALARIPLNFALINRIYFLHHGVDTNLFDNALKPSDPAPIKNSILFLGTVSHDKGAHTLIDAFREVAREVSECRLIFIGPGAIPEMRSRLATYGLAERAHFLGSLPRESVAGWLRACSVVCAPSYGEPYGQNLLEAMATGKPVVATSQGGHPYLVDRQGGIKVVPGDAKALSDALKRILLDETLASEMGSYNRALVRGRNSWSKVVDDLEIIYERMISRPTIFYGCPPQ